MFYECSRLDIQNKQAKMYRTQPLSNLNILVGILLDATDLLESNKDMTLDLFLRETYFIKSIFMLKGNVMLGFISNLRKIIVEKI